MSSTANGMNQALDPVLQSQILVLVEQMADQARDIATRLFRSGNIDTQDKDDDSPVTLADKMIETKWREMIDQQFPDHSIMGEEFDDKQGETGITWVLDPIDGTRQFVFGMPLFGSLIGVLVNGTPVIGCIEIPMLAERWIGAPNTQTTLNGAAVSSAATTTLPTALLMSTSPAVFNDITREPFARLLNLCKDVRFGTDCYAYGLVASGHCDLVAEAGLKPVDVMALIPVLVGAGAVVTDWAGQPYTLDSDGTLLASATSTLHQVALAALAP